MNDIILSTQNGEPVASSRDVAKRFGKEHNHVLRDIKALEEGVSKNGQTPQCSSSLSTPTRRTTRTYPMYLMNRDGFPLLAMGFTGKEAVQWKLKYIEASTRWRSSWPRSTKSSRPCRTPTSRAPSTGDRARKKLDENTAFLDECRKNREDSKAKYMQVKGPVR